MHSYIAFGLKIQSELKFIELLKHSASVVVSSDVSEPRASASGIPLPDGRGSVVSGDMMIKTKHSTITQEACDITIQFGDVNPYGLVGAGSCNNSYYEATAAELWLHVPEVARFLVTNGRQIIIDRLTDVDDDSIRLFVLGSCFGALLMQRYLFVLHGNAIQICGRCISFVGDSGVGKSTLSGAFFKRGYRILADDVCAVNTEGFVLPSFPQIKLWADSAKHLMIETQLLKKIRPCTEKFAVPLGEQFHNKASKLKIVYVLNTHSNSTINITPLVGVQKINALQNNLYRKIYLNEPARKSACLKQCMHIASQIDMALITRPIAEFKLDELVDLIESDLITRASMMHLTPSLLRINHEHIAVN